MYGKTLLNDLCSGLTQQIKFVNEYKRYPPLGINIAKNNNGKREFTSYVPIVRGFYISCNFTFVIQSASDRQITCWAPSPKQLYSRNRDFIISAHTNEPNDLLIFIKEVDLSGLHIDTEMADQLLWFSAASFSFALSACSFVASASFVCCLICFAVYMQQQFCICCT